MIYGENGLDINQNETRKSLNIPVKDKKCSKVETKTYIENGIEPIFMEGIKKAFRKIDYQQFLTRFRWHNLPEGLNSELVERVHYFCGSGMFFYIKELDRFFFLPYSMANNDKELGIDFYGQFNQIKPYSFNGAAQEKKKEYSADIYLATQIRDNIRDIPLVESVEDARRIYENGAVICFDTSPGLAYQVDCRNREAQSFIDYEKEVLIQTHSALINSSGFNMLSSDDESGVELLQAQIDAIYRDRRKGKLAAVVSSLLGKLENLQSNAPAAIQDFFAALQSVDNLRLKSMGIRNDGMQQKSQYQNIQSQQIDIDDAMQIYWNSFMERIRFSAIVNSIWGLGIYPEPLLLPQEQQPEETTADEEGDTEQAQKQGGNDET